MNYVTDSDDIIQYHTSDENNSIGDGKNIIVYSEVHSIFFLKHKNLKTTY